MAQYKCSAGLCKENGTQITPQKLAMRIAQAHSARSGQQSASHIATRGLKGGSSRANFYYFPKHERSISPIAG